MFQIRCWSAFSDCVSVICSFSFKVLKISFKSAAVLTSERNMQMLLLCRINAQARNWSMPDVLPCMSAQHNIFRKSAHVQAAYISSACVTWNSVKTDTLTTCPVLYCAGLKSYAEFIWTRSVNPYPFPLDVHSPYPPKKQQYQKNNNPVLFFG